MDITTYIYLDRRTTWTAFDREKPLLPEVQVAAQDTGNGNRVELAFFDLDSIDALATALADARAAYVAAAARLESRRAAPAPSDATPGPITPAPVG
jgi:hypothetical protein